MSKRAMYLIGMLVLLFLANIAMLMGMTNWPARTREGFVAELVKGASKSAPAATLVPGTVVPVGQVRPEGFIDYLSNGFETVSMGPYDGRNMAAGLPADAQGFRARMPNVPLNGPAVEVGPDNLFIFKNNECKPECCGSTLSCDGGCVCSTPDQRDFINTRGGNRKHDDGF
jgi:hypothetical protein